MALPARIAVAFDSVVGCYFGPVVAFGTCSSAAAALSSASASPIVESVGACVSRTLGAVSDS